MSRNSERIEKLIGGSKPETKPEMRKKRSVRYNSDKIQTSTIGPYSIIQDQTDSSVSWNQGSIELLELEQYHWFKQLTDFTSSSEYSIID